MLFSMANIFLLERYLIDYIMLARNEYLKIHNDNSISKILIGTVTVYLSTLTRNKQEDALHLGFGCL